VKNERLNIIAIDGPAGSGKSTLARKLAQHLHYLYLDTGAMYRVIALKAVRQGFPEADGEVIAALARETYIEFQREDGDQRVFMDGEDVSAAIRAPEISELASKVSVHPPVRTVLVEWQREIAGIAPGVVAEGRDTTTVVFPTARLKIFLTAAAEVRARRRYQELLERGIKADYEQVLKEIMERDIRDTTRAVSPLKQAPDAVRIDNDELDIDQTVARVLELL
jgi:cytidylate kinase